MTASICMLIGEALRQPQRRSETGAFASPGTVSEPPMTEDPVDRRALDAAMPGHSAGMDSQRQGVSAGFRINYGWNDNRLVGFVDWDMSGPQPRESDPAWVAFSWGAPARPGPGCGRRIHPCQSVTPQLPAPGDLDTIRILASAAKVHGKGPRGGTVGS
jgi:hypothetical protein